MAKNLYLEQRLAGIQQQLMGGYQSSGATSTAMRGSEREIFIDEFLSRIFPTPFRFGTGDVTDANGHKSGQLDVVVEYPFAPSIPPIGADSRLYLAEAVAAVIEVKSDLASQWDEVTKTAQKLSQVSRNFSTSIKMRGQHSARERLPLFAVGYHGWKKIETVRSHLGNGVDGILIINEGLFAATSHYRDYTCTHIARSLWGLVYCIHVETNSLAAATSDIAQYAK